MIFGSAATCIIPPATQIGTPHAILLGSKSFGKAENRG